MERNINIFRDFPLYFFIFLTIFTAIKFIFIFFFRAAYEPSILFELTPFHIFSGFNNLQLLLISLIIVFIDMYLHLNKNKKNMMYSFLFTGILCLGIGLAIASREPKVSDVFHYIVFGCLLIIIIIDHRQFLTIEYVEKATVTDNIADMISKPRTSKFTSGNYKNYLKNYIINPSKALISKILGIFSFVRTSNKKHDKKLKTKNKIRLNDFKKVKDEFKFELSTNRPKLQSLDDLDKIKMTESKNNHIKIGEKTDRLLILEEKLKKPEKLLTQDKKMFTKHTLSNFKREKIEQKDYIQNEKPTKEISISKKADENYQKTFDEIKSYAAIIQAGVIKQVKNSLARFLGYEIYELIDEKLAKFVSPESFYEIEKYYISKLKGAEPFGYEIRLMKKDKKKVDMKVTTKQIDINGKNAEIAIFEIIKK